MLFLDEEIMFSDETRAVTRSHKATQPLSDALLVPPPPHCCETCLWCLHAFNQLLIKSVVLVTLNTSDCVWFLEEKVDVPQKGVQRTSRSHTKIKIFQHGLLLCHEFTPFEPRNRGTLSGLTEAIRNLRINAERF